MALENTVHLGVSINEHPKFHEPEAGILLELILIEFEEQITG